MTNQQSNAVKQPASTPDSPQVELEMWQRRIGGDRALGNYWQQAAAGTVGDRIASVYLKKVIYEWQKARTIPGLHAKIWDLMPGQTAVEHVALESLFHVLGNMSDARRFNQLAATIGQRAEYVLFLLHPRWRRSYHLQGLRLASNCDLGMKWVAKRLKAHGGTEYRPLTHAERSCLGALFLELMAESTGLISIDVQSYGRGRKARTVNYTSLYWSFLARWKEAARHFRPLHMPMLEPPKPWMGFDDGGYITIKTGISTVDWERWPEVSKRAKPGVLGAVNYLQAQPFRIDHNQMALTEAVWNLGHEVGSLPSQLRVEKPSEEHGNPDYWPQLFRYKACRRKDGARTRMIHSLVSYRRIEQEQQLHWVHYMDHRGRIYPRGSQINVQGPDHVRSLVQFDERSPIKGHERQFAWSVGEAMGLEPNWEIRERFLSKSSSILRVTGADPLGNKGFWIGAKHPWRLIQLCRDWHGFMEDPGYTSGTIHWRDQTCSGWGHVACLTGDAQLARFTNVTGTIPADLYTGIGRLVVARLKWLNENLDESVERPSRLRCIAWWRKQTIPRSLWKAVLMPVIYGRSFRSLSDVVCEYLRNQVKDFLVDEDLRIVELSIVLSMVITDVVKEAVPHARDLARWLGKLAAIQIDAGLRPYWFTPMGLAIESYGTNAGRRSFKLELARRTLQVDLRDNTNCKPDKMKSKRKLVPDFVHSMDAAYLQQFVSHWETYKHPIATVHDCFGTTLENVEMMGHELRDQWARFYSVDWLSRHQGMVETTVGKEVPAPPMVGTLDRNEIGCNPFLFT